MKKSVISKAAFFGYVNQLHDMVVAVEMNPDWEHYLANKAYNEYVINGDHKPVNEFEEMCQVVKTAKHIPQIVRRLYLEDATKPNDEGEVYFELPRSAELWEQYQREQ